MGNWYTNRDLLKDALAIPASTTGDHDQLDAVLESVSRLIDDYLGYHAYPASGTRYYTPREADRLRLDAPLLNVDTIQTSSNGGATYGSTMTSDAYYLLPYNATEESPRRPWWEVEIRPNTTASGAVFPAGIRRSARILGTWGYFDERTTSTAVVSTAIANATVERIEITGASSLRPGMTIRVDSEQMFVRQAGQSGSDTATTSGSIFVDRARNGTVGASHASGAVIQIYDYPVIGRATLYQAQMDYRAKDAPLGFTGGDPFSQGPRAPGGLHPFTRRMLDGFRQPMAL